MFSVVCKLQVNKMCKLNRLSSIFIHNSKHRQMHSLYRFISLCVMSESLLLSGGGNWSYH